MTIAQAISMADSLKPNMMSENVKKRFLCVIDQTIYDEIITQHRQDSGAEEGPFLSAVSELIGSELELAELQEKADVVRFIDTLRGKFHEEILRKQVFLTESMLTFLTGMEELLQAKVENAEEYDKDELVSFLENAQAAVDQAQPAEAQRPAYDDSTSTSTVLLVSSPHDMLYVYWLICQIDHLNMEMEKYNNDRQLFENAYEQFSDWYTRTHYPKQKAREFRI